MLNSHSKWAEKGITVAGGHGLGKALNQLGYPWNLCLVEANGEPTIYISEYSNQRITAWKSDSGDGMVAAGGKNQGDRTDQLNGPANVLIDERRNCLFIAEQGNRRVTCWPRALPNRRVHGEVIISEIDAWGLALDRQGGLYVSDYKKHEVRRWRFGERTESEVVAGGHGKGDQLQQLHCPANIFVDHEDSLYISDLGNYRVMKWRAEATEGIVVADGHGSGNELNQLSYPSGLTVDQQGTLYVVDSAHHRVMRWLANATEGSIIIGRRGQGYQSDQLNGPVGLALDPLGHLYVADNLNHRIQKYFLQ